MSPNRTPVSRGARGLHLRNGGAPKNGPNHCNLYLEVLPYSKSFERTDFATEVSLELQCRATLRFRQLHRRTQGYKPSGFALRDQLVVRWALLGLSDTVLRGPLWRRRTWSERIDFATEVSLELQCRVTLWFRQLHRWNQEIKLSRLALGKQLHVCRALLDSIDMA